MAASSCGSESSAFRPPTTIAHIRHEGYRALYASILCGEWEAYDAYDATLRDKTDTNLHDAIAYCGVFRTWQGWMALSSTGAGEGTLLVFPALREATAYFVLRPFFRPINHPKGGDYTDPDYLASQNWELDLDSASYPGSVVGKTQEMTERTHPHLRLGSCMVPMRHVTPGDYVLWHCGESAEGCLPELTSRGHPRGRAGPQWRARQQRTIHPSMSTCESNTMNSDNPQSTKNAEHLREQRDCLQRGESGPDFPGGAGEAGFTDRGTADSIVSLEGRQGMGLAQLEITERLAPGAKLMRESANKILFA